ncbi:hypothetical protein FRB96_001865 [Tulasnella sp. 330]|nr:hypothetical protein FRB96_001865 [Tulasnella sp. 330]
MLTSEHAKAAGTYLLNGTVVSLQVLESFSDFIPVPFVKLAVTAASQAIQVAQTIETNRDNIVGLTDRVYAIMLVVVLPLKGKNEKDIPPELKANLARLSKDLFTITDQLKDVKAKTDPKHVSGVFHSIFNSAKTSGIIQDCTDRLNWAVSDFQVESRIDDAIRLSQVASDVHDVRGDVKDVNSNVTHVGDDVKDVKRAVQEMADSVQKLSIIPSLSSSSVFPPKPEIFYGRDDLVNEIVRRIISVVSARFGILGSGGMGKTALALAVAAHPDVIKHFGVDRRHWARCDEATSPGLLVEIAARTLGLDDPSNDRIQDVMTFLLRDTHPRLLVLDNFETPWDIEGRQSDVEDVLCTLAAVPHLTILITMRGTLPGSTRIRWTKPELFPLVALSPNAAQQLWFEVCDEASDDHDEALDDLLAELDYVPLAVTLMAKVGRDCMEGPKELLSRWKSEGTDIMDEPGADRRSSVNMSIEFSLKSKHLKNNPDALNLLSVISALPGGVRTELFPVLIPSIKSAAKAEASLLEASLLYSTRDKKLRVLSPIRSYMAHHHPLTPTLWDPISTFYSDVVCTDSIGRDTPAYNKARAALLNDEINIESVLTRALRQDRTRSSIMAVLRLSEMATYTSPDLLNTAIGLARELPNARNLLAQLLESLGYFEYAQCQYDKALTTLAEAVTEHEFVGNDLHTAKSLLCVADIYRVQTREQEAQQTIERARTIFERLEDRLQIARCTWRLAEIDFAHCQWAPARAAYERARGEFRVLDGGAMEAAVCLQCIADIDMMEERYDAARPALEEARRELVSLECPTEAAACLRSLGSLYLAQDMCDEARELFKQAKGEYETLRHPSGIARSLVGIGEANLRQNKIEEGQPEVEEAKRMFQRLGIPSMVKWCDRLLGCIQPGGEAPTG